MTSDTLPPELADRLIKILQGKSADSGALAGGGKDCPASQAIHHLAITLVGDVIHERVNQISEAFSATKSLAVEKDLLLHMSAGHVVETLLDLLNPETYPFRPLDFGELHDLLSEQFPEYRCKEWEEEHPNYLSAGWLPVKMAGSSHYHLLYLDPDGNNETLVTSGHWDTWEEAQEDCNERNDELNKLQKAERNQQAPKPQFRPSTFNSGRYG